MQEKLKRLRNAVHRAQWRYTLETYAYPIIGDMEVAAVDTPDILRVLRPIWESKCEDGLRLRGRIGSLWRAQRWRGTAKEITRRFGPGIFRGAAKSIGGPHRFTSSGIACYGHAAFHDKVLKPEKN